jgi:uncharacterized protein (DUF433 family)
MRGAEESRMSLRSSGLRLLLGEDGGAEEGVDGRGHSGATADKSGFVWYVGVIDCRIKRNAMPHERIEMNPDIMGGKPVVRGTRIPVELVLRKLGAGMSAESILKDHPRLRADDIHAGQTFAGDYLASEDIVYG